MKNLKKLTRNELSKVSGGLVYPGLWCCCGGSGCSSGVYGDSSYLYCSDSGTSLSRC